MTNRLCTTLWAAVLAVCACGIPLLAIGPDLQSTRSAIAKLQEIVDRNPGTAEAKRALVEQVYALAAVASADPVLDARRRHLVEIVERDETVPRPTRAKIGTLSANIDVITDRTLDPDQKLDAFSQIAWRQADKFPEILGNYESLLRIARDSNDRSAKAIAEKLIASQPPVEVAQGAHELLNRIKLIGKSLRELLGNDVRLPPTANAAVCVFSWTVSQPSSLARAKALQQYQPIGTTLIGICLDADASPQKILASNPNSPAQLVFPLGGKESALCRRLSLRSPAVYISDNEGVITSVAGINWLSIQQWKTSKLHGRAR